MATLNRKFLKALGVDEDKIDAIIEAHTDVTSVLVKERDEALSKAGDIEKLTRERDELKQKVTQAASDAKAEVQAAFDAFKKQVADEKAQAAKTEAVTALLKDRGARRPEFIEFLLSKVDLSKVVVEDGAIKDTAFIDALQSAYSGCFGEIDEHGAGPHDPPSGGNQKLTKEAFFKKSLTEQMAYANEHPDEWAQFNK